MLDRRTPAARKASLHQAVHLLSSLATCVAVGIESSQSTYGIPDLSNGRTARESFWAQQAMNYLRTKNVDVLRLVRVSEDSRRVVRDAIDAFELGPWIPSVLRNTAQAPGPFAGVLENDDLLDRAGSVVPLDSASLLIGSQLQALVVDEVFGPADDGMTMEQRVERLSKTLAAATAADSLRCDPVLSEMAYHFIQDRPTVAQLLEAMAPGSNAKIEQAYIEIALPEMRLARKAPMGLA